MAARYTGVLARDAEGWYTATCPALPGAVAEAASRDEAIDGLQRALAAWLDAAARRGERPRDETPELVADAVAGALRDLAAEGAPLVVETVALSPRPAVVACGPQ